MPGPALDKLPQTAIPLPMDAIAAFCARWDVVEFALFGSVLRPAEFHNESDVDVLIRFDPTARPTLFSIGEMTDELAEAFGRPVDLLERTGVERMTNPYFRREILGTAEVVYAR